MKTFILSVFALFLWLSADVCSGEIDDDYWVKTNFPDKEVLSFFDVGGNNVFAATTDGEIYEGFGSYENYLVWEKLDLVFEGKINCFEDYIIGTDKGLYIFNRNKNLQKIEYFDGMNVIHSEFRYVLTDENLYKRCESDWIQCPLPEGNILLADIEVSYSNVYEIAIGITISGELFMSVDTCNSWQKVVGAPEDHKFTIAEWSDHYESFYIGSNKGFFVFKDSLIEVPEYTGGYVSSIKALRYIWGAKIDKKGKKTQFDPFYNATIVIGTSKNGVYEYLEGALEQKNDSLTDLEITTVSGVYGYGVLAGTNNSGVFQARHIAGIHISVPPLNLTPYALKISPNPAKSRATITFHNPEYAEIEIAIYDLFGRKVTDVHSGHLAEGDYNFPTDLSGLAAGKYFLRFGVGGRVGSLSLIVE